MAGESEFPEAALVILRRVRWGPQAGCAFDGLSGGLIWSDEFPPEAIFACMREDNWAFRYVWAYRASLIRGEPREELRAAWDQLARECPDWPGFLPERRAPELRELLAAENDRLLAELDALFDEPEEINSPPE